MAPAVADARTSTADRLALIEWPAVARFAGLEVESPLNDGKSSAKKIEFGIEAARGFRDFDPPQPDDLLGFVVATADAGHRLELIAAFDLLHDALLDEIVCNLLLGLSDVDEPERVTLLDHEKRVIDDHEVGELSPDQVVAYLRALPGPVRSIFDPSWARALDPKAKEPSMLLSAKAFAARRKVRSSPAQAGIARIALRP